MLKLRRMIALTGAVVASLTFAALPASAAPSEQDTQWMVAAHQSNLAEIAAGTVAQSRATTATVRDLGAMFVEMHTALDADLTAAAQQLGVALPPTPSAAQQQALAAVEANPGAAFDSAWIAQQLQSHAASLANGQRELQQGSDPVVLALAQASAPVVQSHYDALVTASAQYGTPDRVEAGSGGQSTNTNDTTTMALLLIVVGVVAVVVAGLWLVERRRTA